ncbi:aminotransferase class V-fold PLP-dependent enzyme [Maritalea mediterranea]|uniref:Kynureninase n=1 Tax=Maritalea mediterranea TaxID=2909667 RepID=A0ABS9E8G6_9HYPH|nr:aminotransferase class V-fold PLP-dependent enzyme [Maritalea mediterranea]MCF4099169.1 aminotransferase class V-fold PLP-dependent enzyme [Maritalea mediterranea]
MQDLSELTQRASELDNKDPIAQIVEEYEQAEGWIFFDSNSVGPVPKTARNAANALIDDWIALRRRGWAERDWVDMPAILGDQLSPMIGADKGTTVVCDNTTINLYKAIGHALAINQDRTIILTQRDNFPTDIHVVQGFERANPNLEVRYVETEEEALAALSDNVAVCTFSHVGYKSGQRWNMDKFNKAAQALGVLTVWDVSHSAGAVPVLARESNADYIVGCGYKYLSTGPGGPAFIYVRPDLSEKAWPPVCGWMGHADIYAFSGDYEPHGSIKRFISGTPMVGANQIAHCAAQIYQKYAPKDIWARHESLSNFFIEALQKSCGELGVEIASPLDYDQRGGHVTFKAPGAGHVVEALIDAKVVSSFRKPDAIRFGLSPVSLTHAQIAEAVGRLQKILKEEIWRDPKYANVSV